MIKVLMVCLGNICRSPLAQGILEHKVAENNLDVIVDSAGTANYHVDAPPDPRSIAKAAEYGLDISRQRGRQFTLSDFEEFDRIYVMDSSNYENVISLTHHKKYHSKVDLLLNLSHPNANMSVPDPYYGNDDGFENVYRLVDAACDLLIKELLDESA